MRSFHKSAKGFTLVEIMIVVAIIALLAAIAIPNLLRARHNANETAAIGAVRTLSTSLESFRASGVGPTGTGTSAPTYPTTLTVLSTVTPSYAPASLTGATSAAAARQGYWYTYTTFGAGPPWSMYNLSAQPQTTGTTGSRFFYVNETGVIKANMLFPAGRTSGTEIQ